MKAFPFTMPLRKHVRYPSFQLFATMDNRKTSPRDGLTLGALTTLHWLAERLGENAPAQLQNLPPIENFREVDLESLESFRLTEDFSVTVISSPKKGVWMLQITEPDFGSNPYDPNQAREPQFGRVFETNVSFKIVRDELRCGFQTTVREPAGATSAPDVYRLAIVRALMANPDFGLRQVLRIGEVPTALKTGVDADRFLSLRRNKDNQLPLVVFVLGTPERQEDFSDLMNVAPPFAQDKKIPFSGVEISRPKGRSFLRRPKLPESFRAALARLSEKLSGKKDAAEKISPAQEAKHPLFDALMQDENSEVGGSDFERRAIAEANDFAEHLCAFGLTFTLDGSLAERLGRSLNMSVGPGDVLLFEPAGFGGGIQSLSGSRGASEREAALKNLRLFVRNYARGRDVRFSGISFISTARDRIFAGAIRRMRSLRPKRLNLKWLNPRRLNLKRLSLKKLSLKGLSLKGLRGGRKNAVDAAQLKKLQSELDRRAGEITSRDEKLALLKSDMASLEAETTKLRGSIEDLKKSHAASLAAKDDVIDYLRDRMTWPETHAEIADWAEEKLKGKLVLVQHAKDLLLQKGAQSADVGQICEALHYLATDYRDVRYKFISEDEGNMRTSAKYNRTYIINPTSDATIREHPEQYRVKYARVGKKEPVDCDLTSHLRIGHSAARLVRIYYFHDDDRKLIVVGSLPQHLKNAGE